MAMIEAHVDASPERCFEVLSDPRSYAYWVVGSRQIRDADPDWPAVGSRLHHTVAFGLRDHTEVEEVVPNRKLRLRAKVRPLGTAMVTVTMRSENEGTALRLEEGPADAASRLLFNPVADKLLHARNETSIDRLRKLVERSLAIPVGVRLPVTAADVQIADGQPGGRVIPSDSAAGFGRGFLAGLVGGIAMSVSTFAEMRLSGRAPSTVPARALERIFAIDRLGQAGETRMTTAAHFVVSGAAAGAWGAIASSGLPRRARVPLLFGIAALPDAAVVPAMGLAPPPWRWTRADMGRTVLHHAVFAAATYGVFTRFED
ncbi:MAG TPA: SRPBCC family protein [Solirubrobacterales bacterium]